MPAWNGSFATATLGAWPRPTAKHRAFDRLVSTIPIPELVCRLEPAVPQNVADAARDLKFNSVAVCMLHVRHDRLGDNFAVMVPDREIIFYRLSKLDSCFPQGSGRDCAADGGSNLSRRAPRRR